MAETTTMDNVNTTAVVEQRNGILSNVRRLTSDPSFKKSFPAIASASVLLIGLIIYFLLQQPSLTPLYASLPAAAATYLLAKKMGGNAPLMAGIIVTETLVAFLSIALMATLIHSIY